MKMQCARLVTVRSLRPDMKDPVRILCIVVESSPGVALVQDIFDDVEHAQQIPVIVEGELRVAEKYVIMGHVTQRKTDHGHELQVVAYAASNIDQLDVSLYKDVLALESDVLGTLS